jgi:uncharacterized membrane protein YedE/YeeE
MKRQVFSALAAGILFGAGLAMSGLADPARVRAFLDITGAWDPTLAFVMGGAMIPMAIAWRIRTKMLRPLAAPAFDLPTATRLDKKLTAGAAIFGIGWGVAGLCPGPAIADIAVRPWPAVMFVMAMLAGMRLLRMQTRLADRLSLPAATERKPT